MEAYETIDGLHAALSATLRSRGLPSSYADALSRALVSEFSEYEEPRPDAGRFSLLVGRYAIRKDDLRIFEAVTDGLKAAAGVAFFAADAPVLGANVAIGVAAARLVRSLAKRGALLSDDLVHVLTILKCNVQGAATPGLSASQILEIVRRTRPEADAAWVAARLASLKNMAITEGGRTMLVSEDADGRWRSHV